MKMGKSVKHQGRRFGWWALASSSSRTTNINTFRACDSVSCVMFRYRLTSADSSVSGFLISTLPGEASGGVGLVPNCLGWSALIPLVGLFVSGWILYCLDPDHARQG
jgi:hypothetical protein